MWAPDWDAQSSAISQIAKSVTLLLPVFIAKIDLLYRKINNLASALEIWLSLQTNVDAKLISHRVSTSRAYSVQ